MTERYSEERRNFLKTIVALGGASAALSTGNTVNATRKTVPVALDASRKTYTETDHIRKYYQTARG